MSPSEPCPPPVPPSPLTVVYDGACPLCRRAVDTAARRSRPGQFRFVPRESAEGGRVLAGGGWKEGAPDSLVAVRDGVCLTHSDAVLQVARRLRFPWNLLRGLALVPRAWRDAVYRWVARRRHRLVPRHEPRQPGG